jgi:2',3'-cyclic-nucleotide 2'-phosphodiesterase/3'-nucleotidase
MLRTLTVSALAAAVMLAALPGLASGQDSAGLERAGERVTDPRGFEAIGDAREHTDGPVEVTLLHDTHFHGNYSNAGVTISQYLGLARERKEAIGEALFIGSGDDIGSSVESAVFEGIHMIDALNASVLDHNTYGNHDFDYGADRTRELTAASEFGWLSANVRDAEDTDQVFAAEQGAATYALEDVDGVTVGLTGVGPRGMELITSMDGQAIELDAAEALPPVIAEMRDAGADIVVVMSHLLNRDAVEVAEQVDGIDVMVGGHSHETPRDPIVIEAGDTHTIFSYVGVEFTHLGELALHVEEGVLADYDFTLHEIDPETQAADPAVQAVQDDYEAQLEEELDEPIGQAADTWGSWDEQAEALADQGYSIQDLHNRNFVAEVLRDWGDADVGITNTGGVRDDLEPGQVITRRDVLSMLPFANFSVLIELSGEQLIEQLENNFFDDDRDLYYHVSGARMIVDRDNPVGERIVALEVGGEQVDPDGTYTVAAFDFLLGRGQAYDVLNEGEMLIDPQSGALLSELVMDHILEEGEDAARVDGRIAFQ